MQRRARWLVPHSTDGCEAAWAAGRQGEQIELAPKTRAACKAGQAGGRLGR